MAERAGMALVGVAAGVAATYAATEYWQPEPERPDERRRAERSRRRSSPRGGAPRPRKRTPKKSVVGRRFQAVSTTSVLDEPRLGARQVAKLEPGQAVIALQQRNPADGSLWVRAESGWICCVRTSGGRHLVLVEEDWNELLVL